MIPAPPARHFAGRVTTPRKRNDTMTLHEIATIWAEGTGYTANDLVKAYKSYVAECEEKGREVEDAETFFEHGMGIKNA